jgi:septal ring factor EnvC (AmiA/AmiB activator)
MTKKSLSDLLREEVQQTVTEANMPPVESLASPPPPPPEMEELGQALTAERNQNKDLQQQINTLTSSEHLNSQRLEQIEAQLQQSQQKNALLQGELDHLAVVAQQLSAAQMQIRELEKTITELERQLGDRQIVPSNTHLVAYQVPPARYFPPHQPSAYLSNEEIGWFD